MHEGGIKSVAHKIMHFIFIVFAIVVICYFGRVVLSYINSDGTVIGGFGNCKHNEGMSILEKGGVFGNLHPKCKDDSDSDEEAEDSEEEQEEAKPKDKDWRSKY